MNALKTFKRALCAALIAFIGCTPLHAQTTIGNLKYTFSGTEATVVGYVTKPTGALTIPATVSNGGKTYTVTAVGSNAFQYCTGLTSFSMPNVTSIGEWAFTDCTGLTSFSMPNVTSIGESAFNGCRALKSVSMPKVKVINHRAFQSNSALEDIGEIPDIEEIHSSAFYGAGLKKITIPISIKHLGAECLRTNANTLITVTNANTINEQGLTGHLSIGSMRVGDIFGGYTVRLSKRIRMIVPQGKAALIINKWHLCADNYEIYSPVTVNKSNSNYSSMVARMGASFTYEGKKYENFYNWNYALDETTCKTNPTGTIKFFGTYQYKWFVATDYRDVNSKEGLLTITNPKTAVNTNAGFLLKGPAAKVLYVPVIHTDNTREMYGQVCQEHPDWAEYQTLAQKRRTNLGSMTSEEMSRYNTLVQFFDNDNSGTLTPEAIRRTTYTIEKYTGTNYFKAGTGAAVAKKSGGFRNFYYTDPTGFWECANTVIQNTRAYLALPADMTANAKTIKFVIDDDDETTGIINISELLSDNDEDGHWYTIGGMRLNGKPTEKGIYIHNGRKGVIQ